MKIKKFNENIEPDGNGETWKDFFIRQTASGRRFKEIFSSIIIKRTVCTINEPYEKTFTLYFSAFNFCTGLCL